MSKRKSAVDVAAGQMKGFDEARSRNVLGDKKARNRTSDGTYRKDPFPFNTKKSDP
jgi:hypothetical protein